MGLTRFECKTQRLAGAEQMTLADDVVERARSQPLRERRGRFAFSEEIIH
jgi:hypothetical protein